MPALGYRAKASEHRASLLRRLEKYSFFEPNTGCQIWFGTMRGNYGTIGFFGISLSTRRASYLMFKGSIPHGHFVMHKCDNPSCINPEHLSSGTPKDNTRDMFSKGRWIKPVIDRSKLWGERQASAKFKDAEIPALRSLHNSGLTIAEIARRFNTDKGTMRQIIRRITYKHID